MAVWADVLERLLRSVSVYISVGFLSDRHGRFLTTSHAFRILGLWNCQSVLRSCCEQYFMILHMLKAVGFANMVFCFKLVKDKILPVICIDWLKSGYLDCDCSLWVLQYPSNLDLYCFSLQWNIYCILVLSSQGFPWTCLALVLELQEMVVLSDIPIFLFSETGFLCVN